MYIGPPCHWHTPDSIGPVVLTLYPSHGGYADNVVYIKPMETKANNNNIRCLIHFAG